MLCHYLMRYGANNSYPNSLLLRDRVDGKWSDEKYRYALRGAKFEALPCFFAVTTLVRAILGRPLTLGLPWKWQPSLMTQAALLLGTVAIGMLAGRWIYRSLEKEAFPLKAYQTGQISQLLQGSTEQEKEQHAMKLMITPVLPTIVHAKLRFHMAILKFSEIKQFNACFIQNDGVHCLPLDIIRIIKEYMSDATPELSNLTFLSQANIIWQNPSVAGTAAITYERAHWGAYEYLAEVHTYDSAYDAEVSRLIHENIEHLTGLEKVMYLKLDPNVESQMLSLKKCFHEYQQKKQWMELLDVIQGMLATSSSNDQENIRTSVEVSVPDHLVDACLTQLDEILSNLIEIDQDPHSSSLDRQIIHRIQCNQIIQEILKNVFKSMFVLAEMSHPRLSTFVTPSRLALALDLDRDMLTNKDIKTIVTCFTLNYIKSDLVQQRMLVQKLLRLLKNKHENPERAEFFEAIKTLCQAAL